MATRSKSLILKAREDKARRDRLKHEKLSLALEEASTDEERQSAAGALSEYYEEREAEAEKKSQLKEAKLEARRAKREAGHSVKGPRIQWVDGGRDLVPGISKRGKEFFAAASGNLVKCSRDITRWETDDAYSNVRGVKKGEIVMVISDHRTGSNNKSVVDVMVGPDIVKGVPAAALRPLE